MDHVGIYARARSQRASQKPSRPLSYATAIRVISFPALIASSRQRYKSCSSTSGSGPIFFRFAIDTGDRARDQPAGQTHFYNHGQCVILNEGGEACFAIVVGLQHNGAPSIGVDRSDDFTALSRRLPHSIFSLIIRALVPAVPRKSLHPTHAPLPSVLSPR